MSVKNGRKSGKPVLELRPFTEEQAREMCTWHYPGLYAQYDCPDWDIVCRQGWAVACEQERAKQFRSICEDGCFIGFLRIRPDGCIGVGLAPAFCGGGRGAAVMALAKAWAASRPLWLAVRPFNQRAIRCYARAGFRTTGRYRAKTPGGLVEMLRMEWP